MAGEPVCCMRRTRNMTVFSQSIWICAHIAQKLLAMPVSQYVSGPISQSTCCLIDLDSLRALALGAQVDLRNRHCAPNRKTEAQSSPLCHCSQWHQICQSYAGCYGQGQSGQSLSNWLDWGETWLHHFFFAYADANNAAQYKLTCSNLIQHG